jgi:hypothetical protein
MEEKTDNNSTMNNVPSLQFSPGTTKVLDENKDDELQAFSRVLQGDHLSE